MSISFQGAVPIGVDKTVSACNCIDIKAIRRTKHVM